jgi:hypothetical protein
LIIRDIIFYLDDLLDDFLITHHPALLQEIEGAREKYEKKGGVSHAEMRERLLQPDEA